MLFPQIYKIHVTKSSEDLSPIFILTFFFGSVLMCFYAYSIKAMPVFLCNGIAVCVTIYLFYLYHNYK